MDRTHFCCEFECKEIAHDFWIGAIGLSPNFDKVCELRLCVVRGLLSVLLLLHIRCRALCVRSAPTTWNDQPRQVDVAKLEGLERKLLTRFVFWGGGWGGGGRGWNGK